jgi:hypothetical protein
MEAFGKGFLHHGVDCEIAVEVDEHIYRALSFVKGKSVHEVRQIQPNKCERN